MTTSQTVLASILVGLLLSLVAVVFFIPPQGVKAGYSLGTVISTATTSSAVAVTASARILATTTNALGNGSSYVRTYASICTASTNQVYLNLNGDKAAASTTATYIISAAAGYNACYEITDRNIYSGSITASSTGNTSSTVTVSEYVQ